MRATPALPLVGLLLAAALAATGPASAHGACDGAGTFQEQVQIGPDVGYLQISPDPLIEGQPAQLAIQLFNGTSYMPSSGLHVTYVWVAPDGGEVTSGDLDERGEAVYGAEFELPPAGANTLRVETAREDGTSHTAEVMATVYPDIPVRFQATNTDADPVAGRATELTFRVTDADTGEPASGLSDLRVQFRLAPPGGEPGPAEEAPAAVRDGTAVVEHTFTEVGVYEARFASEAAGFTFEDTPPLKVCTLAGAGGDAAPEATSEVPGAPLALVGLAAIGAALAVRRR